MSRLVIITGASRGIGAALAAQFAADGDTVVGLSRSGSVPEGCTGMAVDVADSAAVTSAIKSAVDEHGPVGVLVANAGITHDQLALRMDDEAWHRVLRTNLDGAFFAARAVLSSMVRARAGQIILVSSVSPFLGIPGQANYAASKAGLVGLARSLAHEVGSRGITVNVVAPGFIATDMTAGIDPTEIAAKVPLGTLGDPADVAGLVRFLASPAAKYITGAVIPVDGGLAMGL
jgi:3-oxoacyl-[acyl-carrier protein] reductase